MAFYRGLAGQKIGAQLVSAIDGTPYTSGSVTVFVTLDAATQTSGGSAVHEGEGYWTFSPTLAQTDGILCAYTFIGTNAVPQTIQIFSTAIPTLTPTQGVPAAGAVAALDLITDALCELNVFMPGESIPNSDAQLGLRSLNGLLGSWAQQSLTIPVIARHIFPLVVGQGGPDDPYTIGSGGNFDVPRPANQQSVVRAAAWLPASSLEVPIAVLTDQQWDNLAIKSLAGTMPTQIFYAPTFTSGLGSIYVWPVPTVTTYQLVLYLQQALGSFADLTTAYQMPPGYRDALMYDLARRLASPNGREVSQDLKDKADHALMVIKRSNVKTVDCSNYFSQRSWFDINSGQTYVR